MENRVHIEIPESDMTEIQYAIETLNKKLTPFLITLSSDDKRALPKMGEGTEPFVEKVLDYVKTHSNFNPPYLEVKNMEVDFNSVKELHSIITPLEKIIDRIKDTEMLAGSEAYVAALSYYNSVKMGMKLQLPEAESIYDDLKERFKRQGKK